MIKLYFITCLLITSMPVVNAHSGVNGVWETLCTFNGLTLVQVEGQSDLVQAVSGHDCVCGQLLALEAYQTIFLAYYQPLLRFSISRYLPSNYHSFVTIAPPSRGPPNSSHDENDKQYILV